MKKIVSLVVFMFGSYAVQAQPWFPNKVGGPAPKLQDVVQAYERYSKNNDVSDNEEEPGEGKNYLFDRWYWYWSQHTDANGNLVSPIKTRMEWEAWQNKLAITNAGAKTTTASNWTFQGPTTSPGGYKGVGRINIIAFHPTDSNIIWIGSAGGGAWKTTDGGLNWAATYNDIPVLGVSDIDFNPQNPNTVYLCTGDRDASDSYSMGVYKSLNGGATWNPTGLQWTSSQFILATCLLINPIDTNSLILSSNSGIYRSFDGGAHWNQVLTGDFKQVLYNPADTNIVYAASYSNANIFRSADGGNTWQSVTNVNSVIRIAMAVSPANPALVKAVFANTTYGLEGIYSSSDSGKTFLKIYDDSGCTKNILNGGYNGLDSNSCSGQGWYDLCIAMSPTDTNKLMVGGVNTYQSTNGGKYWKLVTQWNSGSPGVKVVHADKHFLGYNPLTPGTLYEGNDGGIYRTLNPNSQLWTDLSNGLGITQFYRIATTNQAKYVVGGSQDNGTKMLNNGVPSELTGGDGMDCAIDFDNPKIIYTSSQYGSFSVSTNGGANFSGISNNISSPAPSGAWITPIAIHPKVSDVIFLGYSRLYMSIDRGQTWNSFSPVFSSGNNIDRIALSNTNGDYVFVLVNKGLRYSTDFGNTWKSVSNSAPGGGTYSDITVDPWDENILWAVYSGYGISKVAKYNVTANTWSAQNGQLPDVPVNCITIDSASGTQYIGTDVGVFYRDTTMINWAAFNSNIPIVEVRDLSINYSTAEIWAATYGRGMWKSPKNDGTAVNVPTVKQSNTEAIKVSPNPNKGQFFIHSSNHSLYGQAVSVRLINSIGKSAWQGDASFNSNGSMMIQTTELAKGIYILELSGSKVVARERVVIY